MSEGSMRHMETCTSECGDVWCKHMAVSDLPGLPESNASASIGAQQTLKRLSQAPNQHDRSGAES